MKWSFASSASNSGLTPKSLDEAEVSSEGGFAAFDRSPGGDVENHPDPAAEPEEQSDSGGRAGRGKDRDRRGKS